MAQSFTAEAHPPEYIPYIRHRVDHQAEDTTLPTLDLDQIIQMREQGSQGDSHITRHDLSPR